MKFLSNWTATFSFLPKIQLTLSNCLKAVQFWIRDNCSQVLWYLLYLEWWWIHYRSSVSKFLKSVLFTLDCRLMKKVLPYSSGQMFMTFGTRISPSSSIVMAGKNWNEHATCLNSVWKTVQPSLPSVSLLFWFCCRFIKVLVWIKDWTS